MGRGHAYCYDHFILFDTDHAMFYFTTEWDENLDNFKDLPQEKWEWDQEIYNIFKADILKAFDAWEDKQFDGRNADIIGATNRLLIGIDTGGGTPCIYLKPKEYYHPILKEEVEYKIDADAKRGFNRLLKAYRMDDLWRYPTSAWTSRPLATYG